jgi:hypothetical protein
MNPIDQFLKDVATRTAQPNRAAWTRHQPYLAREVAEEELRALAKRAQESDSKLTDAAAYAKALDTSRGKEVYAAYVAAGQEIQGRVSRSTRVSPEAVWNQIVKAAETLPGVQSRAAKVDVFLRTSEAAELFRQYTEARD